MCDEFFDWIGSDTCICLEEDPPRERGSTIEKVILSDLKIIPNPISKNDLFSVNFDLKSTGKVSLAIWNAKGELISNEEKELSSGPHSLGYKIQSSGVYFIAISQNGQTEWKKLVIL